MASTLNLVLTDELRDFINANCGDGTLYTSPNEFVRAVLREKRDRIESGELRYAIHEGFGDLISDRLLEFDGSLPSLLEEGRQKLGEI